VIVSLSQYVSKPVQFFLCICICTIAYSCSVSLHISCVFVVIVKHTGPRKPECFTKATGDYTKFVMYKENMDTLRAVSVMAKFLRYLVFVNCWRAMYVWLFLLIYKKHCVCMATPDWHVRLRVQQAIQGASQRYVLIIINYYMSNQPCTLQGWLIDLQRTVYPHKWSPISWRLSVR